MKQYRRLGLLIGLLSITILTATDTVFVQDDAAVKRDYEKREQLITMRDGVKLFTSIYLPKDKSRNYPIMLNRTPYSVSPYGPNEFKT
ncbi:MAG: CocE/NonD family hydrolase, partial [Pyrinomonadaceae bacterium]